MGTRTAHASLMRSAWRMVTAVVTATAATVAVGMTTAAPASAHVDDYPPIPWSVDNVVLIAPQVDFGDGNGLDLFGQPLPGHVIWMIDPDDNSYWPVLDGVLFINNSAGLCAKVQIAYYSFDRGQLATRSTQTRCASSNRLEAWNVNMMPYGRADLDYIVLRLQTVGVNGVVTTIDTFGPVLP